MHEMGVVIDIVRIADEKAREEGASKVVELVLQVGQLSAVVPELVEVCYPAAVHETLLENAKLKIDVIPANGICNKCKKVFNIIEENYQCPQCNGDKWELLSGKELVIKEMKVC